jgi:transcriptional regulator with XRE-family HTH domain
MTTVAERAVRERWAPERARPVRPGTGAGPLLRSWRQRRRLSQLDLACAADVSTRHLSYVETGRARPSRAFLLHLAEHLDVPLRGRNDLLMAAGYAPLYGESDLDEPAMAAVRAALDLVLRHHEPFPALVVDRLWRLVRANAGVAVLLEDVDPALLDGEVNVLRLSLDPRGLGARVVDFPAYRAHVLASLRRQAALSGDPALAALYDELSALPGARPADAWSDPPGVVLPLTVRSSRGDLSFFTTMTVFGTAADVAVSELTVEQFFPADTRTDHVVRQWAREAGPTG